MGGGEESNNLKLSSSPTMEQELSYHHSLFPPKGDEELQDTSAAMETFHLQHDHNNDQDYEHQLPFHYSSTHQGIVLPPYEQSTTNWTNGITNTDSLTIHQLDHQLQNNNLLPSEAPYPPSVMDVISLLPLPRCSPSSFLPTTSFLDQAPPGQDTPSSVSSILYDPLLHLNLPPQTPFFKELFQSQPPPPPPPPYFSGSQGGGSSLFGSFGEDDNKDGMISCLYQDGDVNNVTRKLNNGVLDFARDIACVAKRRRGGGKSTKHFTSERDRRVNMNERFEALKKLIPNPSKNDRASVVADAINYIKELLRTVDELKLLVEKKRRRIGKGGRIRVHKAEENKKEDQLENSDMKQPPPFDQEDDPSFTNGLVRTSWLQRKSKDTEVDVRVIDDEVTIKLFWRKKINCLLLLVSKALDELQLDLQHVAGGHIGDYCCFLFNTKIYEGSSVYASAIANKLIGVVDGNFVATPPTTSY